MSPALPGTVCRAPRPRELCAAAEPQAGPRDVIWRRRASSLGHNPGFGAERDKDSRTAKPEGLGLPAPLTAISPTQSRNPRCSHTAVTQTSKLIAESLNVLIEKAEMQ